MPWEKGTVNFEACSGLIGVLQYFLWMASISIASPDGLFEKILADGSTISNSRRFISEAYLNLELAESQPMSVLLDIIRFKWSKVILISHYDDDLIFSSRRRIPVITFAHSEISSNVATEKCRRDGVIVRSGFFLSECCLKSWMDNYALNSGSGPALDAEKFKKEGAIRASLCHYNTHEDVKRLIDSLENIEGWL